MKLNKLFSNGMILAEGKPLRVFGEGDGEVVTVKLGGASVTVTPEGGRWLAELPPMKAGGPYVLEATSGDEKVLICDVMVGRVYLVAGQSNAAFQLRLSDEPQSCYLDDGLLRNFFVAHPWSDDDPYSPGEGWVAASRDGVGAWSAIAYLAGREVRHLSDKPCGVITCAQDASVIESWLPADVAAEYALDDGCLTGDHFDPAYSAWNRGGVIFEAMLSTVFPFSLSGVIWYQGESDTSVCEGAIYDAELLRFMRIVRERAGDNGLPFAVIQIADYDWRLENDAEGWRAVQSAQERAVDADGKSALIISRDVCESGIIHPTRKTEISRRAARALI